MAEDSDGLVERTEVLSGERILADKYEMGACIGEGGMGSVYLAQHRELQTTVAVKLLGESFVEHPAAIARFRREARALAATRHENVVTVMDFGTDERLGPYLVMEHLEGESLHSVLGRTGTLSPEMAVEIVSQMLEGLEAVHEKGIIHRDLKPANVFLVERPGGRFKVKILDFGISKFLDGEDQDHQTKTGAIVGTPKYLAPEQIHHKSVPDARTDLYAVGVCLYRMLIGKMPYAARDRSELFDEIVQGKVIPAQMRRPELPTELVEVMNKALASDPGDRFASASEMRHTLRTLFPDRMNETGEATAPSAQVRLSIRPAPPRLGSGSVDPVASTVASATVSDPRGASNRVLYAAVGLLVAALAGAGGWIVTHRGGSAAGLDQAQGPVAGAGTRGPTGSAGAAGSHGPPLRYGVHNYLTEEQMRERHAALIDYLTAELARPVELRVFADTDDIAGQVIAGTIDLAALPPSAYVRARARSDELRLLARGSSESGPTYYGVLVARADSSIAEMQDFVGKRFCWVSLHSSSGYIYPRALLRQNGIDPQTAFTSTTFGGDHRRTLQLLEQGACDGAAVGAAGVTPSRFRVVANTEQIPYDAFCAGPHVDQDTVGKLQRALLRLDPNGELAESVLGEGDVRGFIAASDADYQPVRDVIQFVDEAENEATRPR